MANSAIVPPKTPLIDNRTGLMAREWYLFFLTVSNLTTGNANTLSIDDLAVGPVQAYDQAAALVQDATVGPAIQNNPAQYDPTAYCAPSSSQFLTGNQSIALTGDVTGSGTTTIPTTLATVNTSIGTYNNVTINGKGLATAGSNVAYLTGNQSITLSGDISGTGTTAIAATLPNIVSASTQTKITYNAKGQVTAGSQAAASDLSNGTTGSGGIVLASSPTIATPSLTTQATIGGVVYKGQRTTGVSSSATTIITLPSSAYTGMMIVIGESGSAGFVDQVTAIAFTLTTISSTTIYGSPGARTYTNSSTDLKVSVASGTWTINAVLIVGA